MPLVPDRNVTQHVFQNLVNSQQGAWRMAAICDGYKKFVNSEVTTLNAKSWNPGICDVAVESSWQCANAECKYSIWGECCLEYQFCPDCLSDQEILRKTFEENDEIA